MYSLQTSLLQVKGIGIQTASKLADKNISKIKDLLLSLPLHYIDRSQLGSIAELKNLGPAPKKTGSQKKSKKSEQSDNSISPQKTEITFKAEVTSTSNFYRRGRSIQSATVKDQTGRVKLMWFNNKFILQKLKKGDSFLFSGRLNNRGTLVHPTVEAISEDSLHTGRIVPVYSQTLGLKIGTLRRIIKEILDNLKIEDQADFINYLEFQNKKLTSQRVSFSSLVQTFEDLHFPINQDSLILARERLATEELLSLIKKSHQIKENWQKNSPKETLIFNTDKKEALIPTSIPFTLTSAQNKSLQEILSDLQQNQAMNRLLIGDVGSGKTVVAGLAARQVLQVGYNVALVAPTRILAEQHAETVSQLLPDINVELVLGGQAKGEKISSKENKANLSRPTLFIGTHALINHFPTIKPRFIIYDEQHRFGVGHRSQAQNLSLCPHVLTMTATPIPRSLMLTIFAHLSLSTIDQMPSGRKPTETWVVPASKRASSYDWILKELKGEKDQDSTSEFKQAILVCPFITPSSHDAFAHVSSVEEKFTELKAYFGDKLRIATLHGQMKKTDQAQITKQLFAGEIDLLITTPVVEVGVDLPAASIIMIENSERFGLASLHQLRGRVGRRGQQGYCLLFSTAKNQDTKKRLQKFSQEKNGLKLAEYDLQRRGAGNIFGFEQSGFDGLRFSNWANLEIIAQARQIYDQLDNTQWKPFLEDDSLQKTYTKDTQDLTPLAN